MLKAEQPKKKWRQILKTDIFIIVISLVDNLRFRFLQVIVGSFMLEPKKDTDTGLKVDDSPKFSSPVIAGGSVSSNMGFRSAVESSGRMPVMGGDDHQGIGGSHFMIQSRGGMPMPTVRTGDWRSGMNAGYDLTGK